MAGFKEVMREKYRMCHYYDEDVECEGCPLHDLACDPSELNDDMRKLGEWETRVMSWSKAHPKPQYCTIGELATWICQQMGINPSLTVINSTPISEEVARELNLMPINECGLNKYVN